MNIEEKITITLSENDVKEIVSEYLTKKGYVVSAGNVSIEVGYEWIGYGRDEHSVPRFKKCTATVKKRAD